MATLTDSFVIRDVAVSRLPPRLSGVAIRDDR
jgi:hypothetical protein